MFKVGDSVRVKENANAIRSRVVTFVPLMEKYLGKEFTVRSNGEYYTLNEAVSIGEHYWRFDESWLEPYNNTEINIKENDFEELLCLE